MTDHDRYPSMFHSPWFWGVVVAGALFWLALVVWLVSR